MCSTLRSSILASIAFWLLTLAPSLADRPNIVLILADDMGWSDPGCYGSEIPTPALDTLARQGMLATRLYTASRCSPSRASIMTGCEPHKVDVGLLDDDSGRPGYRGRLNPDIPTLPELLKKRDTVPTFPGNGILEKFGEPIHGTAASTVPAVCWVERQITTGPCRTDPSVKRETAPSGGSAGGFLHDGRYHQNGSGLY